MSTATAGATYQCTPADPRVFCLSGRYAPQVAGGRGEKEDLDPGDDPGPYDRQQQGGERDQRGWALGRPMREARCETSADIIIIVIIIIIFIIIIIHATWLLDTLCRCLIGVVFCRANQSVETDGCLC
jgi:hypothetical protein